MTGLMRMYTEEELLVGVELTVPVKAGEPKLMPVTIKMYEEADRRRRIEMLPCYIPTGDLTYDLAFTRVGIIVADPDNVKPQRPVGHVFADFPKGGSARWEDARLKTQLGVIALIPDSEWSEYRDDGGSKYYLLKESQRKFMKQVAYSGRIMVGEIVTIELPLETETRDSVVEFDVVKRLVVKAGTKDIQSGYSEAGKTNYDFVTLAL